MGKVAFTRLRFFLKGKFLIPAMIMSGLILVMPPIILKKMLPALGRGEIVNNDFGGMIFVFGGGMISQDYWRNSTVERIDAATELYLQHARTLVISEGNLQDTLLFKQMISNRIIETTGIDIPVIYEFKSRNTFQNCVRADSISIANGIDELILVTSLYHQRRVKMIADKTISVKYRIALMDAGGKYKMETWQDWHWCRRRMFREFAALAKDFLVLMFRETPDPGSNGRQRK